MFSLLLKEIRGFLSSLIGYIVISVFLLLMGLFTWVFNTPFNILQAGFADLDPLFNLAPLIFLFLIPAITMRTFAEEKRTGTIELLLTRPLTDMQIIVSKYLAGLILVLFTLLPTLIYYYSIGQLGDPQHNIDTGAMWGSYLGLLFLGGAFVSIGIFSSAVTSNQIVSFILGVFLSFFVYLGFDFLGSYSLFGSLDGFVKNLGFYAHYHSISRGVVDTRDLLYFVSVIYLFLLLTRVILESRKKVQKLQFLTTLAIVFVLNILGNLNFTRFDLTAEKRHSLSPSTIQFLENKLDDVAYFKVYLTGELPSDLKRIEREIKEKLEECRAYAGEKIEYEFINPYDAGSEEATKEIFGQLQSSRLSYTIIQSEEKGTLTEKILFAGAIITYRDQIIPVQFFRKPFLMPGENMWRLADATVNNIEFQLMDGLRKATREIKPKIAVLQGHGEANIHQLGIINNALSEFYAVDTVTINNRIHALREFDGLMVVKPRFPFSDKDKFVIDQFVMQGGKVAWFIDPMEVPEDTLFIRGQTFGMGRDLNLDDILFTYGVRLNKNLVVDRSSAPIDIPGYANQYHEWYFYPLINPSRNHPVSRNVDPIKLEYASTLDAVGDTNEVKKTVLLSSSDYSFFYNSPARINYGIIEMQDLLWNNLKPHQPIGMMLEGKFSSVFKNRLSPEFLASKDFVTLEKSRFNKMLVVADGDLPMNEVDSVFMNGIWEMKYMKLHIDKYRITNPDGSPRYIYGNREFVLNAIDYLFGDEEMIDVRQRTIMIRRLNTEKVLKERKYWQMLNVAFPVVFMILFGFLQNYLRKRKYT